MFAFTFHMQDYRIEALGQSLLPRAYNRQIANGGRGCGSCGGQEGRKALVERCHRIIGNGRGIVMPCPARSVIAQRQRNDGRLAEALYRESGDIRPVALSVGHVLPSTTVEHYLRTEQPYDCAGSAKCETLGIALLAAIESDDPTALVGLPLIRTCELLREAGIDPLQP